ncbi:hypothetical protein [Mesorhizobium sp.]|uniref:hypothetical protein n=1 Tax=Mesorhizobium sp. TaxID=1871066 RepID=UPI00257AF6D0|nr:hypothetical protein [Mesorhizobium sp.]
MLEAAGRREAKLSIAHARIPAIVKRQSADHRDSLRWWKLAILGGRSNKPLRSWAGQYRYHIDSSHADVAVFLQTADFYL